MEFISEEVGGEKTSWSISYCCFFLKKKIDSSRAKGLDWTCAQSALALSMTRRAVFLRSASTYGSTSAAPEWTEPNPTHRLGNHQRCRKPPPNRVTQAKGHGLDGDGDGDCNLGRRGRRRRRRKAWRWRRRGGTAAAVAAAGRSAAAPTAARRSCARSRPPRPPSSSSPAAARLPSPPPPPALLLPPPWLCCSADWLPLVSVLLAPRRDRIPKVGWTAGGSFLPCTARTMISGRNGTPLVRGRTLYVIRNDYQIAN